MIHGAIPANTDSGGVCIRSGTVSVQVTDLTKAVTFSTPMPNASYVVILAPNGLLGSFTASALTANGFTLNLPGVTGIVGYVAISLV
jgi:hypothetical protein